MAQPTNLYEYYTGQGQALPSVQARQGIAGQAGIQNYSGTANQNNALLAYLQGQGNQGQATFPVAPTTPQIPSSSPADSSLPPVNSIPPSTTPPPNPTTPPQSSNPYLNQVQALSQMSPAETNAQQQLNQLQQNATQGQFNVSQQPIAQGFISGQQAAMQTQANIAQQPLQNQLALAQQQRQMALDAAKTGLTYSQWQAEMSKPVFGGYGTSGYQLNPQTGQYQQIGETGVGSDQQALITQAISEGRLDPSQLGKMSLKSIADTLTSDPNHNFITGKQALTNSTSYMQDAFGNIVGNKKYPGATGATGISPGTSGNISSTNFSSPNAYTVKSGDYFHQIALNNGMTNAQLQALNPQIADISQIKPGQKINLAPLNQTSIGNNTTMKFPKADQASLMEQQKYADTTQRAFNTANDNLNSLVSYMTQAKINSSSGVPLINSLNNALQRGLVNPGVIAGYQSAISGLRSEYAQVLSRGGEVTDSARNQAKSLIPDNLTPIQLGQVAQRLNVEGSNAIKEANNQIQIIKNRASGKATKGPGGSTGTTSSGINYTIH